VVGICVETPTTELNGGCALLGAPAPLVAARDVDVAVVETLDGPRRPPSPH
jgi:hypothetical protein